MNMVNDLDKLLELLSGTLEPCIQIKPLRLNAEKVCVMLGITDYELKKLIIEDDTFPKPIKCNVARQGRKYFDFDELTNWKNDRIQRS